ncbi:peptidylprolyl isomerase [Luteimonas sp. M1R5S18]|uniref:peptidylprolyl isomerase n=1 Tax=Luteimonas rhizosphaericola TaxID=3042024 RepID=A0ABT6JFX8_9GAMM|nr:peptidylprolyl isomerase [Luteimonas rhizosphaericola]MDH5829593.1 peptidylprolyl isomerase [Luteimonas rhizosphaericola]
MTRSSLLTAALVATLLAPAVAADAPGAAAGARTTQEVLEASTPADWRTPDPADTLYLDLEAGRVVIELAPAFAPAHVGNIRTLAREGFWNGTSLYRSHDNFVVQFGDADADDAAKAKSLGTAKTTLPAEFDRDARGLAFHPLPDRDGWAPEVGFADGFPAARDGADGRAWMAHCYGALGAGRGNEADSSNGAELYVVTGQSPRQLDRNMSVVGRVIRGMELLSVLPRGPAPLGVYEDAAQRTPIRAITLAADLPEAERERIEVLRTDTPTFDAYVESRRNRRDAFYKRPAGHVDLCNIAIPERTPEARDGG